MRAFLQEIPLRASERELGLAADAIASFETFPPTLLESLKVNQRCPLGRHFGILKVAIDQPHAELREADLPVPLFARGVRLTKLPAAPEKLLACGDATHSGSSTSCPPAGNENKIPLSRVRKCTPLWFR